MSSPISLADEDATVAFGRRLAAVYRALHREVAATGPLPASVVHLHGDLGAGKTTLVRSLLQALGVQGRVRSPTYTLVDTYELPQLTCVHVDLYRLRSSLEVDELALRDMLVAGTLMLIEWPDKGGALVPPADVVLTLTYAGNGRNVAFAAGSRGGAAWERWLSVTLA